MEAVSAQAKPTGHAEGLGCFHMFCYLLGIFYSWGLEGVGHTSLAYVRIN